jgi:hypothetical protein
VRSCPDSRSLGSRKSLPPTAMRTMKYLPMETDRMIPGLAPYERRVIELIRNSKDKRARKVDNDPRPST